jgi:hypothetical protein
MLAFVAGIRRNSWHVCAAAVLSVESRDTDWDIARISFSSGGQSITTTVVVPSELGVRRNQLKSLRIRYNPAAPSHARLESSPGKLKVIAVFLITVGIIFLGFSSAWRSHL